MVYQNVPVCQNGLPFWYQLTEVVLERRALNKYCIVYDLQSQAMSEADQLEWATRDSTHEWQRLQRLQEQEQADLELALALSRQET